MYSRPEGSNFLKEWKEKWGKFLLDYAEAHNINVININDLITLGPFNKLNKNAIQDIILYLNSSGFIKYWGKNKNLLRIYWRSLDEWGNFIFNLLKEKNRNIIYGIESLYDLDDRIIKIPINDIEKIFGILVEKKLAKWIEKENNILKII